jgi:voltage-gated potassium channel
VRSAIPSDIARCDRGELERCNADMLNPFRFLAVFLSILGTVGLVIALLVVSFLVLAVLLYFAELHQHFQNSPQGFGEALYLSAVTALTVGYGDLVPHTVIGRCLSLGLALLGIMLTGIVAAAAVKALEAQYREKSS